ncbi:helix-turn-helix transcriptional regulator [Ostreiculturibacter nitratireducens]|uniref:helix-turn-helix domain-containing protein n=1 Tax=Ostreiculturibacter nitratireducens TaxID=3075226 RepID=UPI0031B5E317
MTNTRIHSADSVEANSSTFGDRLAAARQAQGLSREDLARRTGIRLATLSAWENGRGEPASNRLQMLAGMLNVSIMWLLTGEGEGLPEPADRDAMPEKVRDVVLEIRKLKGELAASTRRLGQIEKRFGSIARSRVSDAKLAPERG